MQADIEQMLSSKHILAACFFLALTDETNACPDMKFAEGSTNVNEPAIAQQYHVVAHTFWRVDTSQCR